MASLTHHPDEAGFQFPVLCPLLIGERAKREKPRSPETEQNGQNGNAYEVRTARVWQLQWLTREPTFARYPNPVCLARVLSEHHAAVAAEPLGD